MNETHIKRRTFVANSTALTLGLGVTASSYARIVGSNERLAIGLIGCGSRGSSLRTDVLRNAEAANAEILAVCDIWTKQREGAARHVYDIQGHDPQQYSDYRALLEQNDLHGVVIATPDHQHPAQLRDAANAKLDAYVEKPLAINFQDLCMAYDAVKSNDIRVQNGTQLRSWASFTGCRELVRSGCLGTIMRVEQARNEYWPYWYQYRREIQQDETDWNAFLMNAPFREWSPEVYTAWMGYRPYSNGALGGYMTHFTDLVHYITGAAMPRSAIAMGWDNQFDDAFNVPGSVQAVFEYPEGFNVSYHTITGNSSANYFRLIAANGILDMQNWSNPTLSGEGSQDEDVIEGSIDVQSVERDDHMLDWLKCIRSRQQPNANIDAGFGQALTAIMADEAMLRGKRIVYDETHRQLMEV